jgi:hypothetical protein
VPEFSLGKIVKGTPAKKLYGYEQAIEDHVPGGRAAVNAMLDQLEDGDVWSFPRPSGLRYHDFLHFLGVTSKRTGRYYKVSFSSDEISVWIDWVISDYS